MSVSECVCVRAFVCVSECVCGSNAGSFSSVRTMILKQSQQFAWLITYCRRQARGPPLTPLSSKAVRVLISAASEADYMGIHASKYDQSITALQEDHDTKYER